MTTDTYVPPVVAVVLTVASALACGGGDGAKGDGPGATESKPPPDVRVDEAVALADASAGEPLDPCNPSGSWVTETLRLLDEAAEHDASSTLARLDEVSASEHPGLSELRGSVPYERWRTGVEADLGSAAGVGEYIVDNGAWRGHRDPPFLYELIFEPDGTVRMVSSNGASRQAGGVVGRYAHLRGHPGRRGAHGTPP